MNYLELCKRFRQEVGVSGTGPASISNQSGEYQRLINWIAEAWKDIQISRKQWKFLRGTFTFQTVANKQSYTASEAGISERFRDWDKNSIKSYLTSSGVNSEILLNPISYESFRAYYETGAPISSTPIVVSSAPNMSLLLGHKPNGIYTISGEYYKKPQLLVTDADIPDMPEEFHMLIVYKAMEKYALFESAPEVLTSSKTQSSPLKYALELDQLPDMTMEGGLV